MKVQPTPTSPKVRSAEKVQALEQLYHDEGMHRLEKPGGKKKGVSLTTVVLSVVLGFAAGALGSLVATVYLMNDSSIANKILGVTTNTATGTTQAKRVDSKTPVVQNLQTTNRSMLALYGARTGDTVLQTTYFAEDQIGSAILLTDDGWAVTIHDALQSGKQYVAVTDDRKVLAVKTVIADPSSNLVFFHIDGTNYAPVSWDDSDVSQLSPYYLVSGNGLQQLVRMQPTNVAETHARLGQGLESSDAVTAGFRIGQQLDRSFFGAALTDQRGYITGVLQASDSSGTTVVPSAQIRQVLAGVLREQKISRPAIGLHYIDLAHGAGMPESVRNERSSGAYLIGTSDQPAVLPHSAASAAGLQSGDVVTKVGGQLLSETADISDLLLQYAPGQRVDITYIRDGVEKTVTVVLGIITS